MYPQKFLGTLTPKLQCIFFIFLRISAYFYVFLRMFKYVCVFLRVVFVAVDLFQRRANESLINLWKIMLYLFPEQFVV